MAVTAGTILAKNMKLYSGATAFTCQVDASMAMSTNMFETTCKDSAANAAFLPGNKSWTASVTGNLAFDATLGFSTTTTGLFDLWDDQTVVSLVFQDGVVDDTSYAGDAYISSLSLESSGNDNAVTFSAEFTGTGAITQAIIT
jgi:hypothetical protein